MDGVPMPTTDVFFDSNVVLYSLSDELSKSTRSQELLDAGGAISVQVLNETAAVLRRKLKRDWPKVGLTLQALRDSLRVVPVDLDVHVRGLLYAERYQLGVYDAMIVAAAVLAGCTTLYSEDMHDGLVIDGLTIRNPYAAG